MAMECPRCRYVRAPTARNPEWQCPGCGVAYAKAQARLEARQPPAPAMQPAVRVPLKLQRQLVGAAMLVAVVVMLQQLFDIGFQRSEGSASCSGLRAAAQQDARRVVLYGTVWCGYCDLARSFFARHGVRFLNLDVEKDAAARRRFEELGGRGFPLIWIDGAVLHGMSESRLCDELRQTGLLAPQKAGEQSL